MAIKSSFSLLNADYVQLNNTWNYKNVISPFYRLYYIENGNGQLSTPEQVVTLEKGFLYLIPSFTLFNQSCDTELTQFYIHIAEESKDGSSIFAKNRKVFKIPTIVIDRQFFERIIELNPGRDLRKSDNPKVYEKSPVIQELLNRNKQLSLSVILETEGIILQLLSHFMDKSGFREPRQQQISSKVLNALNYIGTKLQEKLTVEFLAARASLSSDYFSRLFLRETGQRPLIYIQQKRIERAQFLLVTTDLTLSVVASETGFEDISYFSRLFKKVTGHTPGGYKRINEL